MVYGGFQKGHKPMGGAIKGSKRKNTVEKEKEKKLIEVYVMREFKRNKKGIIDALMLQSKNGNIPAIKEVLERVMGKVTDKTELTGKGGQPISVISFRELKKEGEK